MPTDLTKIQEEANLQLGNKEVLATLVKTTFKGLSEASVRQAVCEGMMRGFAFKDFLEKNVYAIPFSGGYSLVTSIDYARKLGMRSGVVGVDAPVYKVEGDKIISCTITVKRKVGEYVGDFTAQVFFSEYSTNRNLWTSKPRTMIAKVAEMHALRKACPEEMAQIYTEEEMEKEVKPVIVAKPASVKGEIMSLLKKLGADTTKEKVKEEIKRLTQIEVTEAVEVLEEIKSRLSVLASEQK